MLLRKHLKGGVLLYALLMASVFTLLLQCYLGRVVALERQHMAQINASQAYLIAQVTRDRAKEKEGHLAFEQGKSYYVTKDGQTEITVTLATGETYQYNFSTLVDTTESST